MDLKSLMNTSEDAERSSNKAPAQPAPYPLAPKPSPHAYPQQHAQPAAPAPPLPPQQQTPTTPAQGPTYAFRESAYSHALHASPGKPPTPQDYAPHGHPPNAYPLPRSSYQPQGSYPGSGRPAQPSIQTQYNDARDPRSPGSTPMAGPPPMPSPYRQTPPSSTTSASLSAGSAGYPFPPTGPGPVPPGSSGHGPETVASPVQRHQPIPPRGAYPQRDSYPHMSGPQVGATAAPGTPGQPGAGAYLPHQTPQHHHQQHSPTLQQQQLQQQHQMPQTPPIGTSVGSRAFVHQRSQSSHSTPTPTSAQSQHHFAAPYQQGSPVAGNHPLPGDYNRQPSQPPTPLGPPLSAGQRQSSAAPTFAHPPSPYQQRMSTHSAHISPPVATPPQAPPPGLPRSNSSNTLCTQDPRSVEAHQRSQSNSERDRSVSISPKTRVPSLPSSAGGGHQPVPDSTIINDSEHRQPPAMAAEFADTDRDRAATPAKRKLADRDLSPRELEKTGARPPPPGQVNLNGNDHPRLSALPPKPQVNDTPMHSSPAPPSVKKPTHYTTPPVWAQVWNPREHRRLNLPNFELKKRGPPGMNGKPEPVARQETFPSRQASPENMRAAGQPPAQTGKETPGEKTQAPKHEAVDCLGPWEPCITGVRPFEGISKAVADFLFLNVVSNPDSGEIVSRGVQFEIEAKLGTLIDKDTNDRVEKFVLTECVLHDTGRVAFRSSMTAAQHQGMNKWLNDRVLDTNPQNPNQKARGRVQVQYKHRREIDKFFELPTNMQGRLPGCIRSRFSPKHTVKVRVTYDQKTGQPLSKIVKARVADLDLHMPNSPLDCRISINLEAAWDGSVEELEQIAASQGTKFPDRNKDRLSYTQSHYQVDLTQVTQTIPGPGTTQRVEKEHELEIELGPTITIDQGRRVLSDQPHRYSELVEGFVDNIRALARAAGDYV